LNART